MADSRASEVVGRDGWRGVVRNIPETGPAEVELENGRRVLLPVAMLQKQADGRYRTPLGLEDLQRRSPQTDVTRTLEAGQSVTVPRVAEQAQVRVEKEETGTVAVRIVPQVHNEHLSLALKEEHVEIQRVAVNEFVEGPRPVRQEGDTTIVPVYDEVVVVERRLLLREEIHIRRTQNTRQEQQDIPLRTEEVQILRSETPDNSAPAAGA